MESCSLFQKKKGLYLNDWSYTTNDIWSSVTPGEKLNVGPDGGFFTLRTRFSTDVVEDNNFTTLIFDPPNIAAKYYLNGIQIGSAGEFPPNFILALSSSVIIDLPNQLLYETKSNELMIQGYIDSEKADFKNVRLARTVSARRQKYLYDFFNCDFFVYLAAISFMIAFIYLFQFAYNRSDKKQLYFGLYNLLIGIYFHRLAVFAGPFGFVFNYKIGKLGVILGSYFLYMFFRLYLPIKERPIIKRIVSTLFLGMALVYIFTPMTYMQATKGLSLVFIPTQILIIVILGFIINSFKKGVPNTAPLLVGTIIGILASTHDIVAYVGEFNPPFWLQGLGLFVFDFTIFLSLATNTEKMRKDLEQYSKSIEDQVKQRTAQLYEANTKLKQADKAKGQFLANMSHEMRTPLNGIIGFSEHLLNDVPLGEDKKYVELTIKESENLRNMINELLDISKVEAGMMDLDIHSFQWKDVHNYLAMNLGERARKKGLNFYYRDALDEELWLNGDSLRIKQILNNLVGNAIKFTNEGHIAVSIGLEVKAEVYRLSFTLSDTGIGIPEDRQEDIFNSFVQADSSTTRQFGGSGLGMSLAKQLIELMNGDISLTSKLKQGTNIHFSICMEKGTPTTEDLVQEVEILSLIDQVKGRKILVVEDYEPNREVVYLHLKTIGLICDFADNGQKALDMMKQTQYDLILMDIHMPVMDGLQTTEIIRNNPLWLSLPVIALTADAYPQDIERFHKQGMNDVITKPLRKEKLITTVVMHLVKEKSSQFQVNRQEVEILDKGSSPLPLEELIQEFDGDSEVVKEMLFSFVYTAQKQLDKIPSLIEANDLVTAHREIHSIKGGALNLMAQPLSAIAKEIEHLLKKGQLPHKKQWKKLHEEIEHLRLFLELRFPNSLE